jgi:hypothetical protein
MPTRVGLLRFIMAADIPATLVNIVHESDRDAAVASLGQWFLASTEQERATLVAGWPLGAEWPYPDPARLGCTRGERFPPEVRLVASLVLDELENRTGTREHLVALSATYRSCEIAGLDPERTFETVAAAVSPPFAASLRNFVQRSPEARRVDAFGLREQVNADGETEVRLE